ncbi:MAG: pantoate--beta-alanine ligase, partial [Terriglobales bacterium]
PIVREPDGLAMSSRNAYLNADQRRSATVLHRALSRVAELVEKGERRTSKLIDAAQRIFLEEPEVRLDYVEIVDNDTLDPVEEISRGALVAVAAYVGPARLIDNLLLPPQSSPAP